MQVVTRGLRLGAAIALCTTTQLGAAATQAAAQTPAALHGSLGGVEAGQDAILVGWLVGLVMVLLVLAACCGARAARSGWRRRTRDARPRVVAVPDPAPELRLTGGTGTGPSVVLRAEADLAPHLSLQRQP